MEDELRTLRGRVAELEDQIDRLADRYADTGQSLVIQTVAVTSYPTGAGVYYGVQLADPGGLESEGSSGTFGTGSGTFYALVLPGSTVPTVGSKLVVDAVNGRWVVRS